MLKSNTEEGEAHLASDPARDESQPLSGGSEEGSYLRLIDCCLTVE